MNFKSNLNLIQPFMSVDSLAQIICDIGIFRDNRLDMGDKYQSFLLNQKMKGFYQVPHQMAEFLIRVEQLNINSFFNIGTFNGWTITFMIAYLQQTRIINCVSIDVKNRLDTSLPKVGIDFRLENSDQHIGRKFDLCFIDGSHDFTWINKDYFNVGINAEYCAFHDIIDQKCNDVRSYYQALCHHYQHEEFTHDKTDLMGIGLIHTKCPINKPYTSNPVIAMA